MSRLTALVLAVSFRLQQQEELVKGPDAMKKDRVKQIYDLADLQNWADATKRVNPPIRLAVLGDPVAHSLSPEIHNAALRECGIDIIHMTSSQCNWEWPTSNLRCDMLCCRGQSGVSKSRDQDAARQSRHDYDFSDRKGNL